MSDSTVLLFLLFWFLAATAGLIFELEKHFRRDR